MHWLLRKQQFQFLVYHTSAGNAVLTVGIHLYKKSEIMMMTNGKHSLSDHNPQAGKCQGLGGTALGTNLERICAYKLLQVLFVYARMPCHCIQ